MLALETLKSPYKHLKTQTANISTWRCAWRSIPRAWRHRQEHARQSISCLRLVQISEGESCFVASIKSIQRQYPTKEKQVKNRKKKQHTRFTWKTP
jgi:hypothetical protein